MAGAPCPLDMENTMTFIWGMPTRLRRYDEPGDSHFWTISCQRRLTLFFDHTLEQIAVEGLHVLQHRVSVCLIGYVIMPEHVHVIVYPHARAKDDPIPVSKVLHAFKKHVGFHCKRRLREVSRVQGGHWSQPLSAWATGDKKTQTIWNLPGYDSNARTHKMLLGKLDMRTRLREGWSIGLRTGRRAAIATTSSGTTR